MRRRPMCYSIEAIEWAKAYFPGTMDDALPGWYYYDDANGALPVGPFPSYTDGLLAFFGRPHRKGPVINNDPKLVVCPKCQVPVGEPCQANNHRGGVTKTRPHKERMQMANRLPPVWPEAEKGRGS